jgi:hypothetical protein
MSHSIHMPYVHGFGRFIGLSILMALQACFTSPVWGSNDSQLDANTEVQIQVCLPTKRIYFNDLELDRLENHPLFTKYSQQQLELAPKTIRRVATSSDPRTIHAYGIGFGEVLIRSGQFSDGSGFMPLKDSTAADQPVYEQGYGHPAQNYVAMHVRLPDQEKRPEGGVTYWFTLPKTIPDDRFTAWFNPVSMEPGGERLPIWWKLTHGGDMAIYPVSAEPPKMRVTLLKRHAEHNDPTIDTLPALTTARIKYKTATSDQQFVYEFVPKANEAIPACD